MRGIYVSGNIIVFTILCICVYIILLNKRKEKQLFEYAYIDSITKIGNIYYFRKKGQEMLEKWKTKTLGQNQYIIILDINKFKLINKTYGYVIGDAILKGIAGKLEELIGKESLTCRLSNDYFAVLFETKENIQHLLERLIRNLENLNIGNITYNLSVNIGVYKLTDMDKNISEIMDRAIMAHSVSKKDVFDKFHLFDEEIERQLEREHKIESAMYQALSNSEFKIYYQPKFFAREGTFYGAEALVRWIHKGKTISPSEFIPLFEKNKFILQLDLYVFEQVCRDIKTWKEKYGKEPIISVNVSREHFVEENFLKKYMRIASKYGIDTGKIDIEITESATIDAGIDVIKVMRRIKELGFIISIDDFGIGYSSLSTIQDMPVDILKIDKSFIDRIGKNEKNIIDYIIVMAKDLNLTTIAEGVETKEQKDYLLSKGCDIIQGYFYAKPMTEIEFENYLK